MRYPFPPGRGVPLPGSVFLSVALTILAGCGRVGDPLPPFVRIPQAASDLSVSQSAYDVRFQWTSPALNVDQSASTDLAFAEILADDVLLERIEAVAGETQGFQIDARDLSRVSRVYQMRFVTEEGRVSDLSNGVEFTVVDVPEGSGSPQAAVDQAAVRLEWDPPFRNPSLASHYRVYRSGELIAAEIRGESFEDTSFDEGAEYTYQIVPVREIDGRLIEGVRYDPLTVVAVDRTPPGPPSDPTALNFPGGAFLRWAPNPETDLASYRVHRQGEDGQVTSVGESRTTGYEVEGAVAGEVYAISAVDRSGNESDRSASVTIP